MTENTLERQNIKRAVIRVIMVSVLMALMAFTYRQLYFSYLVMENSNRISELLLQRQILLMQVKDQQLDSAKRTLRENEIIVTELQFENEKLREKMAMLDKVVELESMIARLKEKNEQLSDQIVGLKEREPDFNESVQSFGEGKKWLSKYSAWIRQVRNRLKDIKKEELDKKVAAQKEQDRIDSLLGNNGYIVRDGQILPREIPLATSQNVKVEVRFVK
jgi:Zn-dependent M32 family carboxypeptidase